MLAVTSQQIIPTADLIIREAIRAAIMDGLNLADHQMRETYWYYIGNAVRLAYNVTDKPAVVNYEIIYLSDGRLYKVDIDLVKVSFTVKLNSFVNVLTSPLLSERDLARIT